MKTAQHEKPTILALQHLQYAIRHVHISTRKDRLRSKTFNSSYDTF
jgi:hypothetical protein